MTITLPTQALAVDKTANGAKAFFSPADIDEFQRAMVQWQVPACTLVVDLSIENGNPRGNEGGQSGVRVWLLTSSSSEIRSFSAVNADDLRPDVEVQGGEEELTDAAGLQLDSYFAMASCSKPITAYALHLALERAGLSWETPVREVLPQFRLSSLAPLATPSATADEGVAMCKTGEVEDVGDLCTFEDLVSHRSGIGGWHVVHGPQLSERDVVNVLANLPPAYPFRQKYNYASMPFHLAARAVEELDKRATLELGRSTPAALGGRSFIEFVEQEILLPLGMTGGYRRSLHPKNLVLPGHVQFSGGRGYGKAEEVVNRLEVGQSFASGGVLMNAKDLAKWLHAAPRLTGFQHMANERIKDDTAGWLEWRDDGMQSGLGLRTFHHRGVKITNMGGTVPDFATMTAWFPDAGMYQNDANGTAPACKTEVAVGMMANAGTGGCYLRALIRCRAAEKVGNLPRKDWFDIIDKIRRAELGSGEWMHPTPGIRITPSLAQALIGRWTHPSFPDLNITAADMVTQLPDLEVIPYLPFLYGFTRCIFSPTAPTRSRLGPFLRDVKDGREEEEAMGMRFAGCFEVQVAGRAHCGLPFTAAVDAAKERMTIAGWADEGVSGPVVVYEKQ